MAKNIINKPINDKITDFKQLLESISSLEDKRKILWLDIYTNALEDRSNAFNMYISLSEHVIADLDKHAIHAPNIAKYIERMSKANEQLLKLASLVEEAILASERNETMTSEQIYDMLNTENKSKAR